MRDGQAAGSLLHCSYTNATWCLLGALFKNRLLHVVVLLQLVFYWGKVLDKLKLPKVFQTHSSTHSILVPVLAFREHCPRMGTLSSSNSPVIPYPVKPSPCRSINGLFGLVLWAKVPNCVASLETSQELRMLSNVTLNCQVAKIVMNSGSQLSDL